MLSGPGLSQMSHGPGCACHTVRDENEVCINESFQSIGWYQTSGAQAVDTLLQ